MDSDVLDDGDSAFTGTGEADGISTVDVQNKTFDLHAQLALAREEVASLKEALLEKESTINCERQLKKTAVKKMTELKHSLRTTERLLRSEAMRRKQFEVEGTSSRPVVSNGDGDIVPSTPVRPATALPIRGSSVRGGMSRFSEARAETYLNSSVNSFAQMQEKAAGFDPDKFFDSHNRSIEEFAASSDAALWMGYLFRFGVESAAALKKLHEQRKLIRDGTSVDASWRQRTAEMLFNLLCKHNRDKIIVTVIDDLKVECEQDLGDVLEEFFTALKMRVHEVELLMCFLMDLAVAWEDAVKSSSHPLNVCRAIREKIAVEFSAQFEFADEDKLRLHDQDDLMFEVLRCGVKNNLVKLKDLLGYYLPLLTTEEYLRTAGGAAHIVNFVDLIKFAHEAISNVRGEKDQLEALFEARMEELEFVADNFSSSDADDDEVLEVIRDVLEWHKTIASTDALVTRKKDAKPENGASLQSGNLEDDEESPSVHVHDGTSEEKAEKGISSLSGNSADDEKAPHNLRHHGHARKEKEPPSAYDHEMGDIVQLSKDDEEIGDNGEGEDLDEKGDAGQEDDEDHHSDEEAEGGEQPTEEKQEDRKQAEEYEEQRNSVGRGKEGSEEDEVFHKNDEGSEDLVNKRQPRAKGGQEGNTVKDHEESKAAKGAEHHQIDDAEEDQEDGFEEDAEELEGSENQGQQTAEEIDKTREESINNVCEKSGKDQQQPKVTKEGEEIEDSNFGETFLVENDFEKGDRVKQKGEPETKEGLDNEDNVDNQQAVEVQADVEKDEEDNEDVEEEEGDNEDTEEEEEDNEVVEEEEEDNKDVEEEEKYNEDVEEEDEDNEDSEEEEEDDPDVKKQEDEEDIKKRDDDEDIEEGELGDEDGEDEDDDKSVEDREDDEHQQEDDDDDDNPGNKAVLKKAVKKTDEKGEDQDEDHEDKLDSQRIEKSCKLQKEESGSEESFDEEEEDAEYEDEEDSHHEAPQKREESCSEDSQSDEDEDDEDAQIEDELETDEDDSAHITSPGGESATPSSSSSTDSPLRNRRRDPPRRAVKSLESDDDDEEDDADESDDRPQSRSGAGDSKIASQTCTARTKAGNPCKNKPQVGCVYCHVHRNLAQNAKK